MAPPVAVSVRACVLSTRAPAVSSMDFVSPMSYLLRKRM